MSFESLTDGQIEDLINSSKRVTNPNAREVDEGPYKRREYKVVSIDDKHQFRLFTRQNNVVKDDFSVGLQWLPPGPDTLILMRYNGSSHRHPNRIENQELDHVCHVHMATERYIRANLKADAYAEKSDKYQSADGALHELLVDCHITGLTSKTDETDLFS